MAGLATAVVTLIVYLPQQHQHHQQGHHHHKPTVAQIISRTWCGRHSYCYEGKIAVRVAWCESRLKTWARNGQHLGLFQMGTGERARFGHGPGSWKQAQAAHAYYRLSGWSPWYASRSCWG